MRIYDMLAEETADDLFRKITALDAVINDAAATDGEKDNARRLKDRLQQRLKSDYPNERPQWAKDFENSWLGQMARAASDYSEREKRWAADPEEKVAYYRNRLNNLRADRADFYRNMIPGDVYNQERMREYNREIDSILKNHFPEEWQAELAKREKRRMAGYKAAAKKQKARAAELKQKVSAAKTRQGLGTWKEVGQQYEEQLKRFHELLKGLRLPKYPTLTVERFKNGGDTLYTMNELGTGDLRNKWSQLSPEDQQAVVQAVSSVNTLGYNGKGYTKAQKKRILDALRPSKAKPSQYDDPDRYQRYLAQRAERKRRY